MSEQDAESRRTQGDAKKIDGNLGNEGDKASALSFGCQIYLQHAGKAEARYQQNGDLRALDEAATAWEHILHHPNFSALALQFRLSLLDEAGRESIQFRVLVNQLFPFQKAIAPNDDMSYIASGLLKFSTGD